VKIYEQLLNLVRNNSIIVTLQIDEDFMRKRLCKAIFLLCLVPLLQYCTSDMLWEWLHSPDLYYLEVLETVPANNETNVSVNTEITVKLNDNVDPATLISSNFFLDNGMGSSSINYNSIDKVITLIPASTLLSDTTYCATLTTDVKTTVGEPLYETYQWCFTTAGAGEPEIDVKIDGVSVENNHLYNFGILQTNQTRTVTIEVGNSGAAELTIGPVVPTGTNFDKFTIDPLDFSATIPASNFNSFDVEYISNSEGTHNAMIAVPTNDLSENPFTIYLTGTSLLVPHPEITIVQGTNIISLVDGVYDFGTVQTGDTSEEVTFSIENTGSADLTIDSIVLGDKNADEFSLDTSGMLSVLVPGAKTNFNVAFLPLYNGSKKGSITIINNDPVNPSPSFRVKGRGY